MDRLFERFYRASNTGGRSVEGTGIGLSLVRSLVELNGGTVGIESQVDVGTAVTITLPTAAQAPPPRCHSTSCPWRAVSRQRLRRRSRSVDGRGGDRGGDTGRSTRALTTVDPDRR